jgi:hypothetical protein
MLPSTLLAPALPLILWVPQWVLILALSLGLFLRWLFYWPGRNVQLKPVRASKFSPELVPKQLDTIVIGSGSGGSSCANVLAQSGQKVLLLEQHEDRTGGCTHTFRIEGCEWDTGLHYTSEGMGLPTHRAGAFVKFLTKGQQQWKRLADPVSTYILPYVPKCKNARLSLCDKQGQNLSSYLLTLSNSTYKV